MALNIHVKGGYNVKNQTSWQKVKNMNHSVFQRLRSFVVIKIRISDPRSVWIMVHQRNRLIHDQSGFTGSFDAPWSRQILDHWSESGSPQRNAAWASILAPKMGRRHSTWQQNSLVVRRVSPGRIIDVLSWTKYAVPCQIKPGILKLTTSRGQRNLHTVFTFVSCEEKGCYRIVSLGHQNVDCRSYCGLSRRMQGYAWRKN